MLVATWNVNSLKSRLPIVLDWLKHVKPDILLLQEIKGLHNVYPKQQFEDLGYFSAENLQATYNGVAILSLKPITVLSNTLPNMSKELKEPQARFLETLIDNLKIINIYAPNGNPINSDKYTYKINWLNSLYAYLNNLMCKREKFLIAGDFNIIPHIYDTYSQEAFKNDALFQPEVRQLFFKMINLGLIDCIDSYYPTENDRYTWWSYKNFSFEKNNGLRIDHILLCPFLATKLISCNIDKLPRTKEKPSDHTPVICNLDI